MKLYEYQAKEIFKAAGIPVPHELLVDLNMASEDSSGAGFPASVFHSEGFAGIGFPCVIKAQVLQGGRGKAGLVKVAKSSEEAAGILTDYKGRGIEKITLCEFVEHVQELYLSVTVDPVSGKALIMGCAEGGVEIETLAETNPEAIIRETVDVRGKLSPFQARDTAFRLYEPAGKALAGLISKLYGIFRNKDAELVEINPLFITPDGSLVAGDGKLSIDDNSTFRQESYIPGQDYYDSDAEYESALEGIPYLQFDGDISLMCAGAGLTTTVYDLINYEGGSVANYLEFGGPNYRKAKRAMELCLKNDSKVILIVTFGTIARADVMAEGVVEAIKALNPDRPIVTCIRGTNEEGAVETLKAAGLEPIFDTEEAVKRAIELCRGAK
ncbi:MAG: acetate--CoA ligase family protein [Spirochaetales bacterium]|nr:acetate--CoA ligase family protein [Spirochaetales bacterium]